MNSKKTPILSKTRYVAGLKCPLRLWHQCYNRNVSVVSPVTQAAFDTGHSVGDLATRLYPGGIRMDTDPLRHGAAVRSTREALNNPNLPAIYEAAFLFDAVQVKVDILERAGNDKWNIIEVKSSTKVKDEHVPDVGIQCYVLKGAGLNIGRAYLMHVNNQYVYDGEQLQLEHFFSFSDVTDQALSYQAEIPGRLAQLRDMLSRDYPPDALPYRGCNSPTPCEFWEYCTREMPEQAVMALPGISRKKMDELATMGIREIGDIPESFPLSIKQKRARDCVRNGEEYIERELDHELKDVEYPIHFLDFETLGLAIPRYAGTRPYQTVPFQWSDHVLHEDGTVEHRDYLCEEDRDPREEFASTLLDALGTKGSIFMYTTYEEAVLKELAENLPEHREHVLALLDRLKDLYSIISAHFYHPKFHGSFSLKSVLPALLPEMSYETLSIQEGQEAGLKYLRMIDPTTGPQEKETVKKDLLTYCGHDTLAMVRIREELLKRFG
jgi:predicted RecB family nuclease